MFNPIGSVIANIVDRSCSLADLDVELPVDVVFIDLRVDVDVDYTDIEAPEVETTDFNF